MPTLWRLGPLAVGRVVLYRFACRFGFYRLLMPVKKWTNEWPFFSPGKHSVAPFDTSDVHQKILDRANRLRFRVYDGDICDEPLMWLGIKDLKMGRVKPTGNIVFPDGGYVVLRSGDVCGFVRFANFHFRPRHIIWES